jgi:hypothetical protein
MINATNAQCDLPPGTRVLNTTDGEPGTIMNGVSFDPLAGWYEFEVQTQYGIERWLRNDFVRMTELDDAT